MKTVINNSSITRLVVYLIAATHILTGCNTGVVKSSSGGGELIEAGPQLSESIEKEVEQEDIALPGPKLDVIIPVFDPGLSEDAENYEEEGIWPELRRAEANRFALKLKEALDNVQKFGAVRVTPDSQASGDLYLLGEILKSDGKDVEFKLTVVDISGKKWMDKKFSHEVKQAFYKDIRRQGGDPYDPIFEDAANQIVKLFRKRDSQELSKLKDIAQLRFGASFNEAVFTEYMDVRGSRFQLVSMPSDDDPALKRISSIRVREQLFVDSLQKNYQSFSQEMNESYLKWQEASFQERLLHDEAKTEGVWKAIGGVLLIGLSVAAAASASNTSDYLKDAGLTTAAIIGGAAGAWMLSDSFKSREEAQLHKDALDELGESINLEVAPQVVTFEEESVELTGNIQEQFAEWRAFLKRIYEQEATPNETI